MTDADGLLAARFAATRDRIDDADWSDVLRRRPRRQISRRPRLVVAVAVLAIAVAVAVAVAVAGRIRDAFFGTPAPPIVKQAFVLQNQMTRSMKKWEKAHGLPGRSMPLIAPGRAHGVLAIHTSDGLLMLWAAPTRAGHGECWFIDFAVGKNPKGAGTCDPGTKPATPTHAITAGFEWSAAHPTLKVLDGRVYLAAAAITVDFPNHPPATLPVVDHYFLAAYPVFTRTPTKFTAINSHGRVVATTSIRAFVCRKPRIKPEGAGVCARP